MSAKRHRRDERVLMGRTYKPPWMHRNVAQAKMQVYLYGSRAQRTAQRTLTAMAVTLEQMGAAFAQMLEAQRANFDMQANSSRKWAPAAAAAEEAKVEMEKEEVETANVTKPAQLT